MPKSNSLKNTVKILGVLLSIFCTQAFAQLAPVGMEARVITFFKGDSEKNKEMQNLKANNDSWLLQKEQQKYWNTTPGQAALNSDANQQKTALKAAIRTLGNPVKESMRDSWKESWKETVDNSSLLEEAQSNQVTVSKKMNGETKSVTNTKSEKIKFKWRVQAEKLRGRVSAHYKSLSTEANYTVNGRRELASSHKMSELGITTRISYRFDTQSTVTSLDKSLSENVTTRVSRANGKLPESRAEVIYTHSF